MKRNTYISGIITFALLLNISFALNFTVELTYPKKIFAGEKGIATLKITNYEEKALFTFSVFGPQPSWILFEKSNLVISKGETKNVKIYILPEKYAYEATYKFKLRIVAEDGSSKEILLPVKVVQKQALKFSNILINCNNNICIPGEKIKCSIKIKNLGRHEKKLVVKFIFKDKIIEQKVTIGGRKEKNIAGEFLLEKYQKPGKYSVKVEVFEANKKIYEDSLSFSVKKVEKIEKQKQEKQGFFSKEVVIKLKNEGNAEIEYVVYSNASKEILTLFFGEEANKLNGEYTWKVKLKPGETKEISYKEIFLLRIIFIIAIIGVLIYLKFFYVWGVRIKKNIIYTPPVKEGDKISVFLEVKSNKPIKKIVVRDIIPSSFELIKSFETIKPMKKEKENEIELIWKIRTMKPGEERVLHYKLKPKIGIIGSISLPKAIMECYLEEKRVVKKSNSPKIKGLSE
ncbi:MAG TPA: hypothetical protein EYH56_00210 [Nanoarchaeota archaeon]|nr:hypothetical protein [Nanoarchaeota archaeon]